MRYAKPLVIGACVAFVMGFLVVSYYTETSFNPYPQTTTITSISTCSLPAGGCAGFEVDNASLLALNTYEDITSQALTLTITPAGGGQLTSLTAYLDNISLGVVNGPFKSGAAAPVTWSIPTKIIVNSGSTYQVLVEGSFESGLGGASVSYWDSVSVTAS